MGLLIWHAMALVNVGGRHLQERMWSRISPGRFARPAMAFGGDYCGVGWGLLIGMIIGFGESSERQYCNWLQLGLLGAVRSHGWLPLVLGSSGLVFCSKTSKVRCRTKNLSNHPASPCSSVTLA